MASGQDTIALEYQKGERCLASGDLACGEAAFQKILKVAPNDVGARVNLGVIFMRKKNWQKALHELEIGETLAPRVAGIRLNIGLVRYRQGDYAKAIPAFESVLKDAPDSAQARQLLGLCYFFELRYPEAASTLESLWDARNTDLSYLYVLSVASGNAGRHDLEEKATAKLLDVGRDSPELTFFMGKAHLGRDEDDEALADLQQAAAANSKLPFVHYNLGLVFKRKREFEKAKTEFLADLAIEPDVPYNYDELGTVALALGQEADAEKYFHEALKRDTRLATSWYGLAKIDKKRKHFADALKELDQAEDLESKSSSIHYLRAQVLMAMNQADQARRELEIVKRLEKETADDIEQKVSGRQYRDPQLGAEK